MKELMFGICCQLQDIARILVATRRDEKHSDSSIPKLTMGGFQHIREQLTDLLTTVTKMGARVSIFIDNLSDISPTKESNISNWLPSPLPTNVKAIISLSAAMTQYQLEDGDGADKFVRTLIKECSIVRVINNPLPDGRNGIRNQLDISNPAVLLQSFFHKSNRTATKFQMYTLLQHVTSSTSCLQLETLSQMASTWTSFSLNETSLKSLGNCCPDSMVEMLFSILEHNHEKTFYRSVLCFLSLARNGLTQREIVDLVARDNKYIGNQAIGNGIMQSYSTNPPNKRTMRRLALKPTLSAASERCTSVFEINAYWYRIIQDIGGLLMPCFTDGTVTLKWQHSTYSEAVKTK